MNVSAFILSRLDYCISVLFGLPRSTTAPLQLAQNAAARLVMGLSARDHVGPALRELHWLLVAHRIKFKTGGVTNVHGSAGPSLPSVRQRSTDTSQ